MIFFKEKTMKQVTKIFAVIRRLVPAALAAAAVLALSACAPAVEPAGGPLPPPAGKGIVNIQLGVDDAGVVPSTSAARTLLPVVTVNFDSYELTFTPEGGGEPVVKTTLTGIELNAGTYTLVLKAYKNNEQAAGGTVEVTVTEGENTPQTV
jgi:hypothetical protein